MHIGMLEPHLRAFGGIRRILEFANRLVDRGHEVTIYVPEGQPLGCDWMPCRARVRHIDAGTDDEIDVLIFNHEVQWYLVERFQNARRTVFYALHDGRLYGKEGSWEALHLPVDLRLANSSWTADRVEEATGERPPVVLSGVSWELFHPVATSTSYPLLCVGDDRWWKGTHVLEEAADRAGLPLRSFGGRGLAQSELAGEYSSAEIFLVGSDVEGFGQPGIEALACGVPLVTTDNGGCRDYAIDGETALVVPPRDPEAMADAILRLRAEPELGERLVASARRLLEERFDWERNTDHLERLLAETVERPRTAGRSGRLREEVPDPRLSVVVLAWDQLLYTQRCVHSLRMNTDVPYELIIVDNGSAADARTYAEQAADTPVLNESNRGFAAGMNQGLGAARGKFVAFCNNDTEFPPGWASSLLGVFDEVASAGIVVPAVTAAGNPRTVLQVPGTAHEVIDPFDAPPSAVVYVMPRQLADGLDGWSESYEIASGEDVDLAFKVWVNDRDIVFDRRVLVEHVGKGTTAVKLPDWRRLWADNREQFLDAWTSDDPGVRRLPDVDPLRFQRNLATARAVAGWMRRYFDARKVTGAGGLRTLAERVARISVGTLRRRTPLKRIWGLLRPRLPVSLTAAVTRAAGTSDRERMFRPRDRPDVPWWVEEELVRRIRGADG